MPETPPPESASSSARYSRIAVGSGAIALFFGIWGIVEFTEDGWTWMTVGFLACGVMGLLETAYMLRKAHTA
jgi:hypothetical protein